MPLGSSSAAPVTRPGPSLARKGSRSVSAMRLPQSPYGCLAILFGRSLEPLCNDVPFARTLAARRRFGVLDACEAALELRNQAVIRAAREHLCDKSPARPKHFARELQRRLDQRHRAQMIGL